MITLFKGSILDCKVDAIVNPANNFLRHGGGLAAVIDGAARGRSDNAYVRDDWRGSRDFPEYVEAVAEYERFTPGLVPTGGAVLGPPGALCKRFKAIIHAVGPVWGDGTYCEGVLLYSAYHKAMTLAIHERYHSIAFPAISAGVFGMPIEEAAWEAVQAAHNAQAIDVTFALMSDEHIAAFQEAAKQQGIEVTVA